MTYSAFVGLVISVAKLWLVLNISAAQIQPEFPLVVLQDGTSVAHNEIGPNKSCTLFIAYSFCIISKYPYFTALRDCLSW